MILDHWLDLKERENWFCKDIVDNVQGHYEIKMAFKMSSHDIWTGEWFQKLLARQLFHNA